MLLEVKANHNSIPTNYIIKGRIMPCPQANNILFSPKTIEAALFLLCAGL
jgi:hypothetical protein